MSQGPVLIFDKSTLESLSLDEAILLDNFYMSNITPLFYVECLADLERKMVRMKSTPEQLVGSLAERTPDSQAKLFKPKDGVHDPVVLFHEGRIIDLFAVGNGLDKCFEIVSLMQKRVRRHGATSPETLSAWSICRREKLPVKAFSGSSLWLFREREKERRPDPPQGRLVH
jgi:hypothetical protein